MPKTLGKIDNHKQQPWKVPLSEFIEDCYFKRFKKESPTEVISIEKLAKHALEKKLERKQYKKINCPMHLIPTSY